MDARCENGSGVNICTSPTFGLSLRFVGVRWPECIEDDRKLCVCHCRAGMPKACLLGVLLGSETADSCDQAISGFGRMTGNDYDGGHQRGAERKHAASHYLMLRGYIGDPLIGETCRG